MIMMFMVLVVFVPSILVEGEGVDEGPLVALAVPTEPASSQRSTDQKNKADGLSENSHLGLQVVGHEHCPDWNKQGRSHFYTRFQRNILIRLSRCVKIVRMPCRVISNLYAPQNQPSLEFALTLRRFLHKTGPSSPPQQGVGIKSRLYNIFVMYIMEITSFGGKISKTVHTKEKVWIFGPKYEDNDRSIISRFTLWSW